jgi:hypothetical protein
MLLVHQTQKSKWELKLQTISSFHIICVNNYVVFLNMLELHLILFS